MKPTWNTEIQGDQFANDYKSSTMSYKKLFVKGYLTLYVPEDKIMEEKANSTKYFILDHTTQTMQIFQDSELGFESTSCNYEDIEQLALKRESDLQLKNIVTQNKYIFTLLTEERIFVLYAPTEEERNYWIHTFIFIIKRNEARQDQLREDMQKEEL